MIRTAVLVSGDGIRLQTILDSMYFGEIPDFELAAVICTDENETCLRRCKNAGAERIVVDPANFPTKLSYSTAIAHKLQDMDVELVVLAGYDMPLGTIARTFRNRIIGVYPSLIPAFEDAENPVRSAMERGCRVTGATSYFADAEGKIGAVIGQQPVEIRQSDEPWELAQRILEEAEWKLLAKAVALYCGGRLELRGDRVLIKE